MAAPQSGSEADVSGPCRQIETYLCQKNEGHLIRVVGPSFDLVSRWATDGVPLKVAFRGIDRYCERYYRKGPRRRPVHIDFCEADVLDVFDEWRRATGVSTAAPADGEPAVARRSPSLPEHLERVVLRLTNARATGTIGPDADGLIDRVAQLLDRSRASSGGIRGEARSALIDRLAELDAELMALAPGALNGEALDALGREADEDLSAFRSQMTVEAFARARDQSINRLLRERLGLPVIAFSR